MIRLAAIGCSFTNYIWPTYADVLQADRYGLSGIGNDRIWYILMHLYKTNQLQLYDGIIIQWTSPFRFDYLTSSGWTFNDGNIAFSKHNNHIWNKIKEWYNEEYETAKSENFILAAKSVCDKIKLKNFHMSMTHLENFVDLDNLSHKFTGRYHFNSAPWTNAPFKDGHPNIIDQISIAEKCAEFFNITINPIMIEKCNKFHKKVIKGMNFDEVEKMYELNFPNRHTAAGS